MDLRASGMGGALGGARAWRPMPTAQRRKALFWEAQILRPWAPSHLRFPRAQGARGVGYGLRPSGNRSG